MTRADVEFYLAIVDTIFLFWIVVQGEFVRYYERGVYLLQVGREKERKQWREAKRKATEKPCSGQSSVGSETSSLSLVSGT